MRTAIRAVLKQRNFRAGSYRVGYQACTDSSPGASPDPPLCASNARAFERDRSVIGVVGAYQSICSGIELPILGTSAAGPVAMISPSNTYVGLTHGGPQTGPDEPDRYFPTGVRNYVRLTAPDDAQGAALAELAHQLRRHRIYLLDDGDSTSVAMATYVSRGGAAAGRRSGGRRTLEGERPVPDARPHHSRKASRRGRAHGLCVHERRRARHRPSQGVGRPCCIPGFRQLHLCV